MLENIRVNLIRVENGGLVEVGVQPHKDTPLFALSAAYENVLAKFALRNGGNLGLIGTIGSRCPGYASKTKSEAGRAMQVRHWPLASSMPICRSYCTSPEINFTRQLPHTPLKQPLGKSI